MKVCSSRAWDSRAEYPLCGVELLKGDSDIVSLCCGLKAGWSVLLVEWLEGCEVWNRLRASEGEGRGPPELVRSSALCAAAF
jgi:hypothetical protein